MKFSLMTESNCLSPVTVLLNSLHQLHQLPPATNITNFFSDFAFATAAAISFCALAEGLYNWAVSPGLAAAKVAEKMLRKINMLFIVQSILGRSCAEQLRETKLTLQKLGPWIL